MQKENIYEFSHTKWFKDDIEYLKEHYPTDSKESLLNHYKNFSWSSITAKASSLNIRRACMRWSEHDVNVLRELYDNDMSIEDICLFFNGKYSKTAIRIKADKLGLFKRHMWTDEETHIIIENYETMPIDELSRLLPNRTLNSIALKAKQYDLLSFNYLNRHWEPVEDEYIKSHWETCSDDEIAEQIGRTFRSVKWRRKKLGIIREVPEGNYEYLRDYLWKANRIWRKESIKACGYKCIVTGGQFNAVHHLYSSNLIVKEVLNNLGYDYNKVRDYSDDQLNKIAEEYANVNFKYPLGVCLSEKIHRQFHNEYGYGYNTPEQFQEFLNKYYPTTQIPVSITVV